MSNYNINLLGKKYQTNLFMCVLLFAPILFLGLFVIWCMYGGVWRFGENYLNSGWTSIVIMMVVFGSFKINGVRFALLPEMPFLKLSSTFLWWSAFFYYWATILIS